MLLAIRPKDSVYCCLVESHWMRSVFSLSQTGCEIYIVVFIPQHNLSYQESIWHEFRTEFSS
jgi:hypothetical protein